MPQSEVNFTLAQGGLGQQLPGTDYYSGLVFYVNETKATASYLVTSAGGTGDTIAVKVLQQTSNGPTLTTIANYTVLVSDTTATLVATGIKNAINAGSSGYTATSSTATVTITAASGQGSFLNTGTPLSVVVVGTVAGTITQFSGGAQALPSGFGLFDRIKPVYQIQDAEALGILADYSDETKATASYLVTNAGATGDTVAIKVTEPNGKVVTIGNYTRASGDTTVNLVATAIGAAINLLTGITGYSASVGTATVTITARAGLGIFLNSGTPLAVTISGSVAGTITQFSGGIASLQAAWHYHIDWFFKSQLNNQGVLYLDFATTPSGSPTFTEISDLQTFTSGKLKQIGIYNDFSARSNSHLNTIQGICTTLEGLHMGVSVFYAGNLYGTSQSALTTDLGTLSDPNVTDLIGQDGAALGSYLYTISGKSIGTVGVALGTCAAAAVSQSIAEVGAFNVSDGTEYDVAAFATGELVRTVSQGRLDQLNDWGYVSLRKFMATTITTGTYFNTSRTCVSLTSDYCFIERVRTVDKAKRVLRDVWLPLLNSRFPLNSDGTLQTTTIANFQAIGGAPLNQMTADGDLSGTTDAPAYQIVISPTQKILQTGIFATAVKLVPVAIGRQITVIIGYVTKIS